MAKDTYIRIRLTAEEKERIKEAAKQHETNMSDFVLTAIGNALANDMLIHALEIQKRMTEERQALSELLH